MNYKRIYEQIVSRGKKRILEGYKERHHVIPRCIGGSDDPENLVDLTPEEHYVCHQLLVKIHPEHPRLVHAIVMMSGNKRGSNKLYGWHKKLASLPRTPHYEITCIGCGCVILRTKYHALKKKYPTRWCSRKCKDAHGNVVKVCMCCGSLFTSKRHKNRTFCTNSCYWSFKRENKIFNM